MPQVRITAELDAQLPTPVRVAVPDGTPSGELQLREVNGGRIVPAQRDGDELVAVIEGLAGGDARDFHVEPAAAASGTVTLKEEGEHGLSIVLPEGLFTTYHFDPANARPFFYPVLGPAGKAVTRNYPMQKIEGEDHDHPHHRSFWTAYGEVNGVDDWSEEPNHGFIKPQKIVDRKQGASFAGFTALNLWTSPDGKPLLDERRTIRVYNAGPDRRLLDYDVELIATYGDVHYGDTKEGGILAFRVASTMDGKRGGRIENSSGGIAEKQCWGKQANWLDYSGEVDGQVLGIAMMDHPGNFHHPPRWHARDYGLVGTNPFATKSFEGGEPGGYTQKKGETLRFRYRVLIHHGNARDAKVDEAYHAWIQGPKAGA